MAFLKFKENFLFKKYQKELQLLATSKTPNDREIHSVAILTTERLSYDLNLTEVIKEKLPSVRNVHIYSFRDYKKSDAKTYKHFTERDIDWRGNVRDSSFESFLENPFDLLIAFFDQKHLYLEYAALQSNAAFKIGLSNINNQLFDMVIDEKPSNLESFAKTMKKYLELLHKI